MLLLLFFVFYYPFLLLLKNYFFFVRMSYSFFYFNFFFFSFKLLKRVCFANQSQFTINCKILKFWFIIGRLLISLFYLSYPIVWYVFSVSRCTYSVRFIEFETVALLLCTSLVVARYFRLAFPFGLPKRRLAAVPYGNWLQINKKWKNGIYCFIDNK